MIFRYEVVAQEAYKIPDEIAEFKSAKKLRDNRIINIQEFHRDGVYRVVIYYTDGEG